jgi:hypothetical protein
VIVAIAIALGGYAPGGAGRCSDLIGLLRMNLFPTIAILWASG